MIVKNKNSEMSQTFSAHELEEKKKHRVFPLINYDPSKLPAYTNDFETVASITFEVYQEPMCKGLYSFSFNPSWASAVPSYHFRPSDVLLFYG
jgi:hypothetical protein